MTTTQIDRARLAIRLVEAISSTATGTTVLVALQHPDEVDVIDEWCRRTDNSVFAIHDDAVEVYRGRLSDPSSSLPADRMPGSRLWLYTNFHCNLACDYCCVSSSPRAEPRILAAATVRQAVAEGVAAGVQELYLTGGEPFMHPELVELVASCTAAAPTVMLTNAMLFRGSRLKMLEDMPRDGLILQISLDSPTPDLHDLHRGAGSWQRAVDGITTARSLGFQVRLAATLAAGEPHQEAALNALCDRLGLDAGDTIVRRIAKQGVATRGVVISRGTVVPEVCVTAEGVYWHPVSAIDPEMQVTSDLFPLAKAIDAIRTEFLDYRRKGDLLAAAFPCA
ncbi:MAG: radical SAM protein [Candidatus Nanopelagicales bacterium]